MVTVVNNRLEPQHKLEITARVYDLESKLRWEHRATTDVAASSYKEVFAVPAIADLTPVHFVKLELRDEGGRAVSDNFYWLPSKNTADLAKLEELPLVKVNASMETETRGKETVARVKVENPSDRLAFFVHLAVTKGPYGEEVVPVWWEDNYVSLAPGEVRCLSARFATEDLGGIVPALEVGGWNVEGPVECTRLEPSKPRAKAGEPLSATATIVNTFIDGGSVVLYVDGKPSSRQLVWARAVAGVNRRVEFPLRLSEPGNHEIRVGASSATVVVEP
jgi:hypothetical protein